MASPFRASGNLTSVPAPITSLHLTTRTQLYNGVLFAEDIYDTNGITFSGNSTTVISGVVYTPGASFNMHGNPAITLNADFVVHDIALSGNVIFNSYAALTGVANPLTSIALVE